MRKNRTGRVLLLATGCILVCMAGFLAAGCGGGYAGSREKAARTEETAPGGESQGTAEESSEKSLPDGEMEEDSGNSGTDHAEKDHAGVGAETAEMDWFALEETLRPSIVQITCGGYAGSGVVWEVTEEEVVVAGSGHLLRNADACEVVCYAGVYYEAEVERVLGDCDIGFAVFSAEGPREDGVKFNAVVLSGRGKEELVQGEELAVYGSMDRAAGNFVKGYLVGTDLRMQIDGYESEQELLLGGIVREGVQADGGGADTEAKEDEGPVDAGMSGSGVFDRRGELVGILAGGDGRWHFAAVPVWKVERQPH